MTSATNGCQRLSEALKRLDAGGCEKCGHLPTIDKEAAKMLDTLVWDAWRYAEGCLL